MCAIERRKVEHEQASALSVLFVLIKRDTKLAQEFLAINGYKMITKVFLSKRCVVGFEILKVCNGLYYFIFIICM